MRSDYCLILMNFGLKPDKLMYFFENLFWLYFNILIELSTESMSNSVIKLFAECQAKLLVLKHMEYPVFVELMMQYSYALYILYSLDIYIQALE